MSRVHTWPAFSNHTAGDGGSASNSLEGIHDEIHGLVGGQMGYPQVAGLDPLFFLHHCNVDRLLSLWSAINPGVWVKSGPAEGGTWTIPANATIDANTPLTPFWDTRTGYWASSGVTKTTVLGYTYPEFNGLDLGNQSAVRQAIIQYVNNQYGPGGVRTTSSSARPGISLFAQPPAAGGAQAPVAVGTSLADEGASGVKSASAGILHPFHSRGGPPHTAEKAQYGKEGQTVIHDWACRIHCKKYELSGSYWVLVFLGQVPDDPSQWRSCSSFVGGHYVFVNSSADQCANCRGQADVVSEGFVHLNKAIASRSGLPSFEPSVVSPYLKENLHWRVQAVRVLPVCLCP
jgi:tyrosinase